MTAKVTRIDQILPSLASRDAIGGHVMRLRGLLRERGFESEIYFGNSTPDRAEDGRPITALGEHGPSGRVLLYHLSIGSGVADVFRDRPERKFVNYHNITPADLLEPWIPHVGEEVRWGRAQLRHLAPVTEFAVADSRFNQGELDEAGYATTTAVPLLVDLESFGGTPDPARSAELARQRRRGGADLLFVGKFAPHKAQHDLVKALVAYRRLYDPDARLHLVGSPIGDEYQSAVLRFAADLGLADAVHVAGSVTHEELIAHYAHADVFLCLSDHEGFCVPLIEAMSHRLPIVAFGTTAVPETVADAGIVLPTKRPATVAAAIHRVVSDGRLRTVLQGAADRRVAELALERTSERFAATLEEACQA